MIKIFTAEQDGLNPQTFVPLTFPNAANTYLLKNTGPDTLYMRSDPTDPMSEDTLVAGGMESFITAPPRPAPDFPSGHSAARFKPGDVLYHVKCTGPLVLKSWW
jgi:hypothetical protein